MSRSLLVGLLLAAAATALAWVPVRAAATRAVGPVPKTIILGFDGMDHGLTQRWMDAGDLPNFKRLADKGLFGPLQTTNPAQSPVSWAVFNTGCNPGKTGVAGFVSRSLPRDGAGNLRTELKYDAQGRLTDEPIPLPRPMLGDNVMVPADDFVTFPMALGPGRAWFLILVGGAGLLAGLLVFKLLLRLPWPAALVIALGCAAGGFWWARRYADALPKDGQVPYVINPMQGTSFWHFLDEAGLRTRGVAVASTYPPDHEGPRTQLLAGLGVPDVTGGYGTWSVYTTDEWLFGNKETATSGRMFKLWEDTPGVLQTELVGPRNWLRSAELEQGKLRLDKLKNDGSLSTSELDRLEGELAELDAAQRDFNDVARFKDRITLPLTMQIDRAARAIDFTVAGKSFRVAEGGWSDFIPVEFRFNHLYAAEGQATFHVVSCNDKEIRVLVPPINIDPGGAPPQLPISSPANFAADMEDWIGHPYETLGWACLTNAIKDHKDSRLPEQSFMDDLESTEKMREELLIANLERADEWDVYFQVFSTTDRAGHMLFREFDPGHPKHDAKLAASNIKVWGKTFPLSDAIRQTYINEDRMLGRVLDLMDAGKFGDDALLLLVSDHGFTSFRREVNLNNVLHDLGYLVFKKKATEDGGDGEARYTLEDLLNSRRTDMVHMYVDWQASRAYSMGLGEVFVNLKGREPQGSVAPADYDKVVADLQRDLLALKDPKDGASCVTSVSRRDQLYNGPWWKEGMAPRKTVGGKIEVVPQDGFADLFLGYAATYRVSWGNTMGGLDSESISDNTNHWSGDHVSVDPAHVPGILFSNRKLPAGAVARLIDVAPTILTRYGLDPAPPATEMDGVVLPFERLTR